jgi:hypothetical protein
MASSHAIFVRYSSDLAPQLNSVTYLIWQKETVLVLEENQSLENALRTLLQELVVSAPMSLHVCRPFHFLGYCSIKKTMSVSCRVSLTVSFRKRKECLLQFYTILET